MADAYYRYRNMPDITGSFTLRLRVPASGFGVLSALNPQYGVQQINRDDKTWVSFHDYGDDRPSDYDRRIPAFDGNKDVSEPQCRKFIDICEMILEHAWLNKKTLTKEDVYSLSLSYLPSEYNDDLKRNQSHYEVDFLNEKFISEPFPTWEKTRGSDYDLERVLEKLLIRLPLIAYDREQFRHWPGTS